MAGGKGKRKEERKFKRLEVRYGPGRPSHRALAIQVSASGAFLSARHPIFAAGSRIVVEFSTPAGAVVVPAVVRHAKNLPPGLGSLGRAGMGIELVGPPPELREFLVSL